MYYAYELFLFYAWIGVYRYISCAVAIFYNNVTLFVYVCVVEASWCRWRHNRWAGSLARTSRCNAFIGCKSNAICIISNSVWSARRVLQDLYNSFILLLLQLCGALKHVGENRVTNACHTCVFMTRRYTNPRLPYLTLLQTVAKWLCIALCAFFGPLCLSQQFQSEECEILHFYLHVSHVAVHHLHHLHYHLFTACIFSYSFTISFSTQDLALQQILSSIDLFLSYTWLIPRTRSDHLFCSTAGTVCMVY